MKYALVNDELKEAQPGLSGKCKCCGSQTIAKCGEEKIWHWAHSGKRMCDSWWENETEWHRNWKNFFSVDQQEVIHHDEKNGVKHIADVKTVQGWVLEFQHSPLKPEERRERTAFYEKLVWVVDCAGFTRYKEQFFNSLNELNPVSINPLVRKVYLDGCALLKKWSGIHASVFFDFGEEILWCLLPANQAMWGYVVAFPRREFIEFHCDTTDQTNKNFEDCLSKLNELISLWMLYQAQARERNASQASGFSRHQVRQMRSRRRL